MNVLKEYRTRAGLTQPQLANLVGISVRTLQDYEQGRKSLEGARAITVLKMARALRCTVEELIDPQQGADSREASKRVRQALMNAKTQKDLDRADDLAADAVAAGLLTQREVDFMWEDYAPHFLNDEEG